jgi:3-oxo-5-alpha-steroid 4-dehydrogenase 1
MAAAAAAAWAAAAAAAALAAPTRALAALMAACGVAAAAALTFVVPQAPYGRCRRRCPLRGPLGAGVRRPGALRPSVRRPLRAACRRLPPPRCLPLPAAVCGARRPAGPYPAAAAIPNPVAASRYSARGWGFFIPQRVAWVVSGRKRLQLGLAGRGRVRERVDAQQRPRAKQPAPTARAPPGAACPPRPPPPRPQTQEAPSFLVPAAWLLFFSTPEQRARAAAPAHALLLAAFLFHYAYRSFIYPLRMRGGGNPTPATVWAMAAVFCVFNGWMQARGPATCRAGGLPGRREGRRGATRRPKRIPCSFRPHPSPHAQAKYFLVEAPLPAPVTPRVAAGLLVWAAGWLVNFQSDNILIALRKPGQKGYKMPRGGAFEYVSAANYAGEMLEWAGWAVAAGSAPAAAFAFFTAANLVPRGWRHHQWYKAQFPRYPKGRRAVIPFLL